MFASQKKETTQTQAGVAESADALDSKSSEGNPRAGSSPASGTIIKGVFINLVRTPFLFPFQISPLSPYVLFSI